VRVLAILLLLAVLPSMELAEQLAHVIEHALHAESPGHSAHHDAEPGDEHGCTGLVHLCMTHQAQVTAAATPRIDRSIETLAVVALASPTRLFDKHALEPPHRPPIS